MQQTVHKLNTFRVEDDYNGDEHAEKLGYTIDAVTEFDAAQAILSLMEYVGYGCIEARTQDTGEVVARVNIEVMEVFE